jgi:hypothetical protein
MSEKTMSTPAAAAKGDDRNLVPVEAATTLSFEDQIFLIWKKQRTFILGTLTAVAVVLVAWFVIREVQQSREAGISKAFGEATTLEAKRAFVGEHPDHVLAGVALLALADDGFANKRFDEAARDYGAAAAVLKDPLLVGRARLGEGTANLKSAQSSTTGEQQLTRAAEDATLLMAYRTQAWYILATHAAGAGDVAKARDLIGRLKALDPESDWANLATGLETRLNTENPSASSLEIPSEPMPAAPTSAPTPAESAPAAP